MEDEDHGEDVIVLWVAHNVERALAAVGIADHPLLDLQEALVRDGLGDDRKALELVGARLNCCR